MSEIGIGVDGCGVPVFALKLKNLARAYADLAEASRSGRPEAAAALMAATLAHPEMIAGDERICTQVMRVGNGRFLAKTGAEGTYALALPEKGLGVGIWLEDGHARGVNPTVVESLIQLGGLDRDQAERLDRFHRSAVKNHRGEVVGEVAADFSLSR